MGSVIMSGITDASVGSLVQVIFHLNSLVFETSE